MKVLISPAKSLDFETTVSYDTYTTPVFLDQATQINAELKKKSPKQLAQLMHVSTNLAELNWERNQNFTTPFTTDNARPAIYTFNGDVYQGLDALSLSEEQLNFLQGHTYILSGLYGILRPLDLMQAYRLEMGTKFKFGNFENLYAYWKSTLTSFIESNLDQNESLVNLASTEYSKAVDLKRFKAKVYTPVFKDWKNDQLKVISFFAKKARGLMLRYITEERLTDPQSLLNFNAEGYSYSEAHTTDEFAPVFVR